MYKRVALISICAISILLFLINPAKNIQSVSSGILIWATGVLPALFPFVFLSKILIELDAFSGFSNLLSNPMHKIFGAPKAASYIFLLSVVCGYPIGAKLSAEFYQKGVFDNTQCLKLATFCSTSGPIFILGTVGSIFLNSTIAGIIILFSHIGGAFLNGIFYRKRFLSPLREEKPLLSPLKSNRDILGECMHDTIISVLGVGGFVAIFYMWAQMLLSLPLLNGANEICRGLISGILEITTGCKILSNMENLALSTTLCCFLISFGGICIFLQSAVFYKKCRINCRKIFIFKITQAFFSSILCMPTAYIFLK